MTASGKKKGTVVTEDEGGHLAISIGVSGSIRGGYARCGGFKAMVMIVSTAHISAPVPRPCLF